jgi:hypothetical protein
MCAAKDSLDAVGSLHGAGFPHALDGGVVLAALGTDFARGLDSARAAELRWRYGHNELAQAPPEPWWRKLAAQFNSLVIWILPHDSASLHTRTSPRRPIWR